MMQVYGRNSNHSFIHQGTMSVDVFDFMIDFFRKYKVRYKLNLHILRIAKPCKQNQLKSAYPQKREIKGEI